MATYSGRIIQIIPEKDAYIKGEIVRVKVRFQVERADSWTSWFAWHARVKVFVNGVLKDEDETTFSVAPWTPVDYQEHTTRWFNLGRAPSSTIVGAVEVWCGG